MIHNFNRRVNCILADEMGLGKTLQSLSFLAYMKEAYKLSGPHLIIVPLAVSMNWMNEIKKFTPGLSFIRFQGSKKERDEMLTHWDVYTCAYDVVITTYETLASEPDFFLSAGNCEGPLDDKDSDSDGDTSDDTKDEEETEDEGESTESLDTDEETEITEIDSDDENDIDEVEEESDEDGDESSDINTIQSCGGRERVMRGTAKAATSKTKLQQAFERRGHASDVKRGMWQCIVVDEAHRLKRVGGRVRQLVMELKSAFTVFLTGTPLQNNMAELYALMDILIPEAKFDHQTFAQAFDPSKKAYDTGKMHKAKKLLGSITLRREKAQVTKLLPKTVIDVYVPLSREQNRLTRHMVTDTLMRRRRKMEGKRAKQRRLMLEKKIVDSANGQNTGVGFASGALTIDDDGDDDWEAGHLNLRELKCLTMQLRKVANHPLMIGQTLLKNEIEKKNNETKEEYEDLLMRLTALNELGDGYDRLSEESEEESSSASEFSDDDEFRINDPYGKKAKKRSSSKLSGKKRKMKKKKKKKRRGGKKKKRRMGEAGNSDHDTDSGSGDESSTSESESEDEDERQARLDARKEALRDRIAAIEEDRRSVSVSCRVKIHNVSPRKKSTSNIRIQEGSEQEKEGSTEKAVRDLSTAMQEVNSSEGGLHGTRKEKKTGDEEGAETKENLMVDDSSSEHSAMVAAGGEDSKELASLGQHQYPPPPVHTLSFETITFEYPTLQSLLYASGKLTFLHKLLVRERTLGNKCLIFTQFKLMLNVLEKYCRLAGWRYKRLDGDTNATYRELGVREFNAPDSTDFLYLISTRAGGVGINLPAASTVVIFDADWNPQNDLQVCVPLIRIVMRIVCVCARTCVCVYAWHSFL